MKTRRNTGCAYHAITLRDSAEVLSMPLSVFSAVGVGVDGFVSGAGPVRFYFLA